MTNTQKAIKLLGPDIVNSILSMNIKELDQLDDGISDLIEKRQKKIWDDERALKMTKEDLVKTYESHGYVLKPGDKFWKITRSIPQETHSKFGLEVGKFTHSCHIDTTDFIVLLVETTGGGTTVVHYSDMWLELLYTI